jgi:hypothetical protein
VMATVFWDVHGVLLVDFTPPGSTINTAACQENLKRLKEAIRRKRPGLLTKDSEFFCMTMLDLTVLPQPRISWTPGAGKFFHIHHTVLIWHRRTSIYSQTWKSTSEVSASTPMKMFKMKSRNGYVPRTHFLFYEGLDKLSKEIRWLCGEVKLIWECISAWVTLYVVILFK